MLKKLSGLLAALSAATGMASASAAMVVSYADDPTAYAAATGASSIGTLLLASGNQTVGDVSFTGNLAGSLIFSQVYTNEFDRELAISGREDFVMTIANGGAYAIGFRIHEPTYNRPFPTFSDNFGCNDSCVDTTFSIELFSGSTSLGLYSYNAINDALATAGGPLGFFGVHTDTAFDRVVVRDVTADIDNEYFSDFTIGRSAIGGQVPEPNALLLVFAALTALVLSRRRHASGVKAPPAERYGRRLPVAGR